MLDIRTVQTTDKHRNGERRFVFPTSEKITTPWHTRAVTARNVTLY